MESFLTEYSKAFEERDLCRTYIYTDDKKEKIFGFFSLGIRCLKLPVDTPLSKTTRKKMNVNPENRVIQSYLLGQLCRSDCSDPGFGQYMMGDAFNILISTKQKIGCRMVRVDCSPALKNYYESNGFIHVGTKNNLHQLVTYI